MKAQPASRSFSILVLDFHNTIYDEVMEYGLAIDAAISVWTETAAARGRKLDRTQLSAELSEAHQELGSDWDEDVWQKLPSLKALNLDAAAFSQARNEAVAARAEKSRHLTTTGVYSGTIGTLKTLKKKGVSLYVVTEAAADAGMQALRWLSLGGVIDGFYSYPSRTPPPAVKNTFHKPFPPRQGGAGHIQKPNPALLAAVALDEAKRAGRIPRNLHAEEIFEVRRDDGLALQEFPSGSSVQQDTAARLVVKPGRHAAALQETLDAMLYVGDSKFKDGLMARNAGVKFGFAAYGKKIRPGTEQDHARSKQILYDVTGWDKEALKLTQEAGRSKAVSNFAPDYTFEDTLAEALPLFLNPSARGPAPDGGKSRP
jgi:phosphoglycolate phosphatase-like HAD superfamily hydrolase